MLPRANLNCADRKPILFSDLDDSRPHAVRLVGDERGGLATRTDTQLVVTGREVRLDRALGEAELCGDLAVRVAHGYEGQYLLLAVGEGRSREAFAHLRRQDDLPRAYRAHRRCKSV